MIAEAKPDVLIMDIEGGEAEILEADSLGTIRDIAVEMHDADTTERAFAALERHGFTSRSKPMGTVYAFSAGEISN